MDIYVLSFILKFVEQIIVLIYLLSFINGGIIFDQIMEISIVNKNKRILFC